MIASGAASGGRSAGALDRVGYPGAGGQPVDARIADLAGDVDDQPSSARFELERRRLRAAGLADAAEASLGVVGGTQPAGTEQEQRDGDRAVDEELCAAELGHGRDRRTGRRACGARTVPKALPDAKAFQALGLLVEHLDPLDRGPLRTGAAEVDQCSTAAAGPSNTASTVPSARFATAPASPRDSAIRRVVSRKKTPWTRPWTITRRRTTRRLSGAARPRYCS